MTVFTPVQLIATQQASLAAMFALKKQATRGFQSLVELNFLPVQVAPEKGVARPQEAVCRKTAKIRAVRTAERKSLSTAALNFKITCLTVARTIKSARSHLSADPPIVDGAVQQRVISIPRIAWQ